MARQRIQVSITLPPPLLDRIDAIVLKLPGSNRSGLIEEVLVAGLPMFEAMATALDEARDADGVVDEARAKDRVAAWAGAQLLNLGGMYHTDEDSDDDDDEGGMFG